jgi:acyl-CoA synthetase (AMP-forming)/AMP-acid ligase II
MIEWWGPIIDEYYSGTEGLGITYITATEWLAHPGSVGRPILGQVHIVGDEGEDLGPREIGAVYFSSGSAYSYHGSPSSAAHDAPARGTLDDIGWVDEEGYLYLTDRRTNMIVTGGVNVFPKEAEDVLALHPAVLDVAVFGIPEPELGEVPHAVVQLLEPARPSDALADELVEFCRARLAHYKCPRRVEFAEQLPRQENGKLYKSQLREPYWQGHASRIL